MAHATYTQATQILSFETPLAAMQDKTPLALPFYYEIDDLLHNFRQIVRTEAGDKQVVTAKQPNQPGLCVPNGRVETRPSPDRVS